jgi:hypothetical protein
MRGNIQCAQITIHFVQSPETGMGAGGIDPLRQIVFFAITFER